MKDARHPSVGPVWYDPKEGNESKDRVARYISLKCGPLALRNDTVEIENGTVMLYEFRGNELCLDTACSGIRDAAYPARSEVKLIRSPTDGSKTVVKVTLYYPRLTYARLYSLLAILVLLIAVAVGAILEIQQKLAEWRLEHSPASVVTAEPVVSTPVS